MLKFKFTITSHKDLVSVFHEDVDDDLYKCHANNTTSTMVKKLYEQEIFKVYSERSGYNLERKFNSKLFGSLGPSIWLKIGGSRG